MKRKVESLVIVVMAIALTGALLSSWHHSHAKAATGTQSQSARKCPYHLDLNDSAFKVEIEEILFTDVVDGIQGNNMRVSEEKKDEYRIALVTIKITKPAGRRISVAAADFSLHYYHGDTTEVSICEGISWFSKDNDSDRPMSLPTTTGPGFVKMTTGAKATKSDVVYFDAVFGSVEPETKECWICVGQPISAQPYVCPSPAWTNL